RGGRLRRVRDGHAHDGHAVARGHESNRLVDGDEDRVLGRALGRVAHDTERVDVDAVREASHVVEPARAIEAHGRAGREDAVRPLDAEHPAERAVAVENADAVQLAVEDGNPAVRRGADAADVPELARALAVAAETAQKLAL